MNEMNQSVGATRPFAAASRETAALALRRFPEYYVDAGEGAKFLGIHRRTVLQMARDSVLPAHPLGEEVENSGDSCCPNWTSGCVVE